ncbi:MAG: sulfite exporter TauE/SafE family protein [Syntrophobacteraceae bacterium]
MTGLELGLVGLAAVAGGAVNALAGGGTLITFPMLIALGVPAVASNVTNTVALCPGYLGGTLAQLNDLRGSKKRLWLFGPAGVLGGVAGGVLLLNTSESLFRSMVPFLILVAAGLLAVQEPVRAWIARHPGHSRSSKTHETLIALPVALAAVYGGYFGAGLSVIVLAVLGLVLDDTLTRLNALKQILAFSINMAAAIFFLFSGQVIWPVALVMAVGALIGGVLGGRLAGWIRPIVLRWIVVSAGVVIAVLYMF